MTPAETAAKDLALNTANTPGQPKPLQGNTASFFDSFWKAVYSFDFTTKTADKVIAAGESVKKTRDAAVSTVAEVGKSAVSGVKTALTFGPILIIGAIALYVFLLLPKRR